MASFHFLILYELVRGKAFVVCSKIFGFSWSNFVLYDGEDVDNSIMLPVIHYFTRDPTIMSNVLFLLFVFTLYEI